MAGQWEKVGFFAKIPADSKIWEEVSLTAGGRKFPVVFCAAYMVHLMHKVMERNRIIPLAGPWRNGHPGSQQTRLGGQFSLLLNHACLILKKSGENDRSS